MTIESELLALQDTDGLIGPEQVTTWARDNPTSELHAHPAYHWDRDDLAAWKYRISVSRSLIRLHIKTDEGERGTISLLQDRNRDGGYRRIEPVLGNRELRAMALKQALREFKAWERRYFHLRELASVFEAANNVAPPSGEQSTAA